MKTNLKNSSMILLFSEEWVHVYIIHHSTAFNKENIDTFVILFFLFTVQRSQPRFSLIECARTKCKYHTMLKINKNVAVAHWWINLDKKKVLSKSKQKNDKFYKKKSFLTRVFLAKRITYCYAMTDWKKWK